MNKLKMLDLFSGIGGFSLAAHWTGQIETVAFCEINKFAQQVLKMRFPEIPIFDDVTKLNKETLENAGIGTVDIICGGFPCQPFSAAGKRKGGDDERALFPAMLRIIAETRPSFVVAENVYGLLNQSDGEYFEQEVASRLEVLQYEVQTVVLPACSVGAPHRRDRIWIIGNAKSNGKTEKREILTEGAGNKSSAYTIGTDRADEQCNAVANSEIMRGGRGSDFMPERRERILSDEQERCEIWGQIERCDRNDGQGIVANSDGAGSGTSSSGVEQDGQKDCGEWEHAQLELGGQDKLIADIESYGLQERGMAQRGDEIGQPEWSNIDARNSQGTGLQGGINRQRQREYGGASESGSQWSRNWLEVATELCRMDDGLSVELGEFKLSKSKHREEQLKAYGNSIVPQVLFQIFMSILETKEEIK